MAVPLLPWARQHVTRVMRRYHLPPHDLWDETITALIRASVHYVPCKGATFRHYAQRAVNRACWRYVVASAVGAQRATGRTHERAPRPELCSLDAVELAWHSSEDEVMAREAAWLRVQQEQSSVRPQDMTNRVAPSVKTIV